MGWAPFESKMEYTHEVCDMHLNNSLVSDLSFDAFGRCYLTNGYQKSAKTKVVLTVDTEASIGGAFGGDEAHTPLIHALVAGVVDGKSEALGFLVETLNRYGLVATFFVETLQTRYFPDRVMGGYVDQLLRAGQDVQLHLHPCWLAFNDGKLDRSGPVTDDCHELEIGRLTALIGEGAERIGAWTGTRPTGMRTGNFSTALSVFEAMGKAGLSHASNICLAVHRPPEPELAVTGGIHDFAGIRELPVTCFFDVGPVGRGRLRPMQVTALTAREQINLLNAAHNKENPVVVIVTHPFEFVKKQDFRYTNLRPNRIIQNRFRRLCAYLSANTDRFEVVPLAVAADTIDPHQRWTELTGNALNSIVRGVANVVNDHVKFI
jgi:peptidoglycan/xylan/chitin deacetylase (PgdA/CDA1 family)